MRSISWSPSVGPWLWVLQCRQISVTGGSWEDLAQEGRGCPVGVTVRWAPLLRVGSQTRSALCSLSGEEIGPALLYAYRKTTPAVAQDENKPGEGVDARGEGTVRDLPPHPVAVLPWG